MKINILILIVALSLFSCNKQKEKKGSQSQPTEQIEPVEDSVSISELDSINYAESDSVDTESLLFWTSDTAVQINPKLFTLLDILYQHVRSVGFPSGAKVEEKWMSKFRSKLAALYDEQKVDDSNMTEYEKATFLIDEGIRLVGLDSDDSTMGMIVRNSTIYTFEKFNEYMLLTKVLERCHKSEIREIVYKEWDLYVKMYKEMCAISSGIVRLNFWTGSIEGPISTGNYLSISKARKEMYQTILDIMSKDSWESSGVFLDNAQKLLLDCSLKAASIAASDMKEYMEEYDDDQIGDYEKLEKDTKSDIEALSPILKEWVDVWDKLDEKLTTDGTRHEMERAASSMLLKWASVVSSKW